MIVLFKKLFFLPLAHKIVVGIVDIMHLKLITKTLLYYTVCSSVIIISITSTHRKCGFVFILERMNLHRWKKVHGNLKSSRIS